MHRGFNPSLSHAYVPWIAFWLQDPETDILLMYSSNLSLINGSSRNKWSVSRIFGVAWQTCSEYNIQYKTKHMSENTYVFKF